MIEELTGRALLPGSKYFEYVCFCVFDLYVKSVFGFHCVHDCLCMSAAATAAEPYVLRFRTSTIPLRSFFITSLMRGPRGKRPPHVTRAAWKHNTIWPKAVQIWPAARLVTPAIALKPMAQGTFHHILNSLNSIFIARAQQRQITTGLIFFFRTIQVVFNGKCNHTATHLVQNVAAKDKTPCVFTDRARELLFCEP